MFIAVRMNITDEQGSRMCLMSTGKTPFIAGQLELVTAAIWAVCWKPGVPAGCQAKLCCGWLACASVGDFPCGSPVIASRRACGMPGEALVAAG
jgi:hypothetical protein